MYFNEDRDYHAYPFIIDRTGRLLLHPQHQGDNLLETAPGKLDLISRKGDSFIWTYEGVTKWYITREFEPWDWVICFTVPLSQKYADVRSFRHIYFIILIIVTVIVLSSSALSWSGLRVRSHSLAAAARGISEGNLTQVLNISSRDEIGDLARSFNHMQSSIQTENRGPEPGDTGTDKDRK